MGIDIMRKEALIWGIVKGPDDIVDRLLSLGVTLPSFPGDFYVTIEGLPCCLLDPMLNGLPADHSRCEFFNLGDAIAAYRELKQDFPAAVIAIRAGTCPGRKSSRSTRRAA